MKLYQSGGARNNLFKLLGMVLLISFLAVFCYAAIYAAPAWEPNVAYKVGDIVTYSGQNYQCIQAHTSLNGWEPPIVPALWKSVSGGTTPTPTRAATATPTRIATATPTRAVTATPTPAFRILPGQLEAEDYDAMSGIQTENCSEGGRNVGWIETGDWMDYNVTVSSTATYRAEYRVASTGTTGSFSLRRGTIVLASYTVPNTGGWQTWATVSSNVNLTAGAQTLRILATGTGWNINWLRFSLATQTPTPTSIITPTPTRAATPTPTRTATPTPTTPGTGPGTNRIIAGYWETWDGIATHPPVGHIPLNSTPLGYNVINVAFPILLSDGTCVLEAGAAPGELPPTPAEVAQAKAAGRKVLLSIGGAAAGIDLNSTAVADRFIATAIQVIDRYGFNGIDIDIETGLVAGPNWNTLSSSQANLIRIINGIVDHYGPGFMLTMAPETAYVTGGTIAYGGPWGAYLPVINAVKNKLTWLQMQYYNGSMYGKDGTGYPAGTVEGIVKQTEALIDGFTIAGSGGVIFSLPANKVVIGLPAAPGAGGGYASPAIVRSALSTLLAKYPNLRGLMTWSVNWDASHGYEFVNNYRPFLDNYGNVQ